MAVTVNYQYPVAGPSTVPPTSAQVALLSAVTAQVIMGDTDTTAAITHNFGTSAANLGSLFPVPIVYANLLGTAPYQLAVSLTNSNVVTLSKISQTGSNGTFNVVLLRPNTNIT
jgi:hypothetical protein